MRVRKTEKHFGRKVNIKYQKWPIIKHHINVPTGFENIKAFRQKIDIICIPKKNALVI